MEDEIVRVVSKISTSPLSSVDDAIAVFIEYRQDHLEEEYRKEQETLSSLKAALNSRKKQKTLLEEQREKEKQEQERQRIADEVQRMKMHDERDRISEISGSVLSPAEIEKYSTILHTTDGDPAELISPAIAKVQAAYGRPLPEKGAWWITMFLLNQYAAAHPNEEEAHV